EPASAEPRCPRGDRAMIPPRRRSPLADDHRRELSNVQRRLFLKGGLSIGALTMLTGCNLQDGDTVDKVLWAMSRWNDRVQALLFRTDQLAPTFPASAITTPFPFNAFYPEDD